MREKILKTEYGDLHYWISDILDSEKKTIFFFHGLTANHYMFEKQVEYFQNNYNLIVWDAPMHGNSKPFIKFDMDISVNIILSILHEHNIDSIIGVGQSFGGYFPQALMCRNNEVIKLFIGIGTSPYGNIYYSKSDYFWLRQIGWLSMIYPYNLLKTQSSKQATTTIDGYDNMEEMLKYYSKKEYIELIKEYYNAFMKDNQDLNIICPTLIIRGEFDRVGKVKKYCDMWHMKTGYPLKIIKSAGHNANVDYPDEVNKIIEKFILDKYD